MHASFCATSLMQAYSYQGRRRSRLIAELLNGAGSTIPSLRALRDGIRHLQAELREELHQVWESISEMAGATSESLIHMQEQLASYR